MLISLRAGGLLGTTWMIRQGSVDKAAKISNWDSADGD